MERKKSKLSELITSKGVKIGDAAKVCFPKNKNYRHSMDRILSGVSSLNMDQTVVLAELLKISIAELYAELYDDIDSTVWVSGGMDGNFINHVKGKYRAELNSLTGEVIVYKRGIEINKRVVVLRSLPMQEFFIEVEMLINEWEG